MTRNKVLIPLVLPVLLLISLLLTWQTLFPLTAFAQVQARVTSPAPGSMIAGAVSIMGTAVIENFQRYELYFKQEPSGDEAYIYFGGAAKEKVNGYLGVWRTSELAPGSYTLRLRVVDQDGNYSDHLVPNLTLPAQPIPTPVTEQPTAVEEADLKATPPPLAIVVGHHRGSTPEGCGPIEVAGLLADFFNALNHGNRNDIASFFGSDFLKRLGLPNLTCNVIVSLQPQ
jgi:hypothetical protein